MLIVLRRLFEACPLCMCGRVVLLLRFPKLRVAVAEQLYSFLWLLPPDENCLENNNCKETMQQEQHLAFKLPQENADRAIELLISTPWAQLPPLKQQGQGQQQLLEYENHPCMQLLGLLKLESEWKEARLPSF